MFENKFRKARVLREIEIDFDEIKKGDLFRLLPASKTDINANSEQYYVAKKVVPADGDLPAAIDSTPVHFVLGLLPVDFYRMRICINSEPSKETEVKK